jgi:hypothetical protein
LYSPWRGFRYDGEKVVPGIILLTNCLRNTDLLWFLTTSGCFAFGTIQNGLILSDTAGQVIFHLNKERGILNNTVLCVGTINREYLAWP